MRKALELLVLTMCVFAACAPADAAQTAAVAEIRARAEQGNAEAQFKLGRMHSKGDGVPRDDVQAVAWFRKAAEQGYAKAQNGLGVMYAIGQGVPQNYVQAVVWFRKAAEQGEAMAQANLGVRYEAAQGVPQDYGQAAAWYRKAAEQGYAEAQFNLSLLYVSGLGVPQDYAQAVAWYRKAAEQGYAAAQFNLGRMYETGRGVRQDFVEAYMWQDLAAARATGEDRKKFADGRDGLAKSMMPAQVMEAQKRAQEWTLGSEHQRTAQANAEVKQTALEVAEVAIAPRTVRPGKPLNLEIAYTATDPSATSRKAAVTMSFSILSGGTTLLDEPGEIVESASGQLWKITKPLTASTDPGAYLIRVRLALGATVVTRDVEFEITR